MGTWNGFTLDILNRKKVSLKGSYGIYFALYIKLFNLFSLPFSSYAFLCTLQEEGENIKLVRVFFGNEIVDDRTNEFTLSAYYYAPSSSNFDI